MMVMMMMRIRPARKPDKDAILSFCVNTFSWGDYIDRVWDYWYADENGRLFVVESNGGKKIAMSHVAICPEGKSIWLEGVRVHPNHRRSYVATLLIRKMLEYGRRRGSRQASAIVDSTNFASKRMMEKNGFEVVSKWLYCSLGGKPRRQKSDARIANAEDINDIWRYLVQSKIYRLSAKRYVKSWHWYMLDHRALQNFVKNKQIIVTGQPIDSIAIINKCGYWDRANILQIVYLDSMLASSICDLVSYIINIYLDGKFESLQLMCYDSKRLTPFINKFMVKERVQFLLYNKQFKL
ncbi:MAG: GNAT family N-acetyltransferase [Thermoproteota archaeon]|nr:GNAT family N-acetyltransferase [Thermoproteota archaeon]